MANFLLLAIVGLIAQLVDGSLGMAYGVTSQSLLLTIGIAPALASASVHIAEVGTTAASGVSHWRFKNVDWAKVWPLAIPGAIGAFFGAVVVSSFITAEAAEPIVAIFLFGLGVFVLARFSFRRHQRPVQVRPVSRAFLAPLGLIAAPIAAYIVRIMPARILGSAVGGLILVTNMKTFLEAVGVSGALAILIYVLIVAVWIAAVAYSIRINRREQKGLTAEPS